MAVDGLKSAGTTALVCNACFSLKWSIFGFYPKSHIENKNKDFALRGRLMPDLEENRNEGPTGPYEERWSKRLCYPRHSNFRGSDMPCPKVREWMVPDMLHHYQNSTELHYTNQYSVVWQMAAKLIYEEQNRQQCFGHRQRQCFLFCT